MGDSVNAAVGQNGQNAPAVWTPSVRVGDLIETGLDTWKIKAVQVRRAERAGLPSKIRVVIDAERVGKSGQEPSDG